MNKEKPNLYEERMDGYGGGYNNNQNYLKGLDDLCLYHGLCSTHNVLELGSNDGVSTSLFAYYANKVFAVDINKSQKLNYKLNLYPNILFFQNDIEKIVPSFPNNFFDFVYIDANHDKKSVIRDIQISLPKLKNNGIICGHDYVHSEPHGHGVRGAVDEFFNNIKVNYFLDTSWSVQVLKQ